jgi:hypothetical protein
MLVAAAPAVAQTTTAPAPKPLLPAVFAGTLPRTNGATSGLLVTLTEAYDENVLAEGATPIQSSLEAGGFYTDLNATFNARVQHQRMQYGVAGGTDFRYYREQQTTTGIGHYGSTGLTYASDRTTVSADGGVAYAPSYLYRLFASGAASSPVGDRVATGYAINDTSSFTYDLRLGVTRKVSSRSRLTFSGSGRYTDFLHEAADSTSYGARDLATYDTGAMFSHGLSRNANLNLGYTYRRAQYNTGVFPTEHDVTIGVDYSRPLSKTRRTLIRFNLSTVMLDAPAWNTGSGDLRRQYRATADANVAHQFGRTWQTSGAFKRGVGYVEGFETPVLTDGVSLITTGMLTRRMDLMVSGSYSVGEPVIAGQSSGFTTYAGDVRTRFALADKWAIYAEYTYYYYDFTRGFVPVGVPPRVSRNSVRAGLTWWVPMGVR